MSTEAVAHDESGHDHGDHDEHISLGAYVFIGVVLAVLMSVKVAIYYIPALDDFRTPILVVLSAVKVVLVVLYYMHLKVDHRVFTWVFVIGAVLAGFMVGALTILYQVLPRFEL